MTGRWSTEKAWEWYNRTPWLRGCNFMGSDCSNRVDQWQEHGFEERLKTADRELKAASEIGYNTIRLILQFEVWDQQHDGFMERLERYLSIAYKHGITAMIVFGNDCVVPKNELYRPVVLGPQKVDWGYHGGKKNSPHGKMDAVGYSVLDEPEQAERFYEMTREIMVKYAQDPRVIVWDMINEPGNANREEVTFPHVRKLFQIAREVNPMQPITSGAWRGLTLDAPLKPVEQYVLDQSDIISYHNYGGYEDNIRIIDRLKRLGRPILNTEWLNRMTKNEVFTLFPLFYLENIGCFNWGFVAGLYQTYEPWNAFWERYDKGTGRDIDFTKWQHDLLRPNHRPYDPREIEVIQKFSKLADEKFEGKSLVESMRIL